MPASRLALALLSLLPLRVAGVGEYDPCAASKPVSASGDLFTFGIAYYPGADVDAWDGLNPCSLSGVANLTAAGGGAAVYRAKVDDMSFMRSSMADENAVFENANAELMTVAAYATDGAGKIIRSDPRRVRATSGTSSSLSSSAGRVNALTLIARFEEGRLEYLQWHDMACRGCATGDACFDVGDGHGACAGTETNCGCDGDDCFLNLADPADALRCHLTVAAAFSGDDANRTPLTTFSQIERLGLYSVSGSTKGAGVTAVDSVDSVSGK
jgi:hypothetical protein